MRNKARPDAAASFNELFGERTGDREIAGALIVPLDRIRVRERQPRRFFDAARLAELAQDIREVRERGGGIEGTGIIQPLLVVPDPNGDGYLLTAGERRWRAAREAGNTEVPVVVRRQDAEDAFEDALRENIQRQDLMPIEEAEALSFVMESRGWSVRQAAERFGKDKGWVENRVRLFKAGADLHELVSVRTDTLQLVRLIEPIADPKLRQELIELAMAGASNRDIERRIAEYQGPSQDGVIAPIADPRPSTKRTDPAVHCFAPASALLVSAMKLLRSGRLDDGAKTRARQELAALKDRIREVEEVLSPES